MNIKTKWKVTSLLSVLFLSSCITVYKTSDSVKSTSTLTIPLHENSFFKEFIAMSDYFIQFGILDEQGCGGLYRLPPPENKEDNYVKVKIPDNKDILLKLHASDGNWSCTAMAAFSAKEGLDYKVLKIGNGKRCQIGVSQKDSEDRATPVKLKKVESPIFSDNACIVN